MALVAACGAGSSEGPQGGDGGGDVAAAVSLLPADYASRFLVVRDCRNSIDHDLNRILIKADPTIAPLYLDGPFPLPAGAVIVKEEFSDPGCTNRVGYTLMHKEAPGTAASYGDWRWQKLDATGRVLLDGVGIGGTVTRCASCHAATDCRARDFTCAEP
jgi:hypothetical protein